MPLVNSQQFLIYLSIHTFTHKIIIDTLLSTYNILIQPHHPCTHLHQEKEEEVVTLTAKLHSLENTLEALKQTEASTKRQLTQTETTYKRQVNELLQEGREDKRQLADLTKDLHTIKRQLLDAQADLKEAKRQGLEAQQHQQEILRELRRDMLDVQQEVVQRDRTISLLKKEVNDLTLQLQAHDDSTHRKALETKFELLSMTEKMQSNEDLFRRREQHWRSELDTLVR